MAGLPPDTPSSTPDRQKDGAKERGSFNLNGHDEPEDVSPHSVQGYDRPDQTVFDLTMDYSDDDTLLDWEQYAGMRKFKCWGMDCSLVARFCPFMPWVPPEWYYRYSRRQRKMMTMAFSIFGALLVLLVGAIVLVSLLPKQAAPSGLGYADEECGWSKYHLPLSIRPTQYDLDMDVQLEAPFLVSGSVQIQTSVTKPSKCVVLHAVGMNITHMSRLDPHTHGTWKMNNQEQLILEFEEAIRPPSAAFVLHFNYTLSQGLSGFYRSSYTAADGESRFMGTTQMEANGARKAFPCFDEPAMKAKWNFSMTAPSDQEVLFNMPKAQSVSVDSASTRHSFQITPPMSSYLVAFIVGNLTSITSQVPYPQGKGPDRPIRIWGTPDRADKLQTALEVATRVLPAYEEMFGVPYALPKLDLVAIPDFAAGAMENWGLITYRETDLLVSANDSSISNERRVALVIAHEMAHLWFGDLVTMKDWGELWLNEGFATYFENVGATTARPNFAFFDTFYSSFAASAMDADAMPRSTHPLATLTGMDTAERVEAMFDSISYDKGGSVLRMLRAFLSRNADTQPLLRRHRSLLQDAPPMMLPEEPFLKGLQSYLRRFQYNNTSSNELWAEMESMTGETVTEWMRTWTFQSGIPLVQVLLDGPLKREVKVYQAPFQFTGVKSCDDKAKDLKAGAAPWWVPLATVTRDSSTVSWNTFSTCYKDAPVYTLQDDNDWIKLNAGQYGLFRVNYPVSLWNRLADAAAAPAAENTAPSVSAQDLAGLLDDSWALSQAGETPINSFLQLTRSLAQRQLPEYAPWSVAAGHIISTYRYLQMHRPEPKCAGKWAAFVRANVTSAFLASKPQLALNATQPENAGAQPDVQPRLLRPLLLGLAAEFNDSDVRDQAMALFTDTNSPVLQQDVDIRSNIYTIVASSGKQSDYDAIKNLYLTATDATEKARALSALAYTTSPDLVNATLAFALTEAVRSQDSGSLIARVAARGGNSLQAAWSFVRTRYADISAKLGGEVEAANAMGKLLQRVASNLADDIAIREVDEVFQAHKAVLTEPRLQEGAKEDIRANMDWLRKNAKPVCDWLNRL